jgi:ATP-dependent Lhr-like helicase
MRFYPRTQQDLILASLCAQSVREKAIEEVKPPHNCLDILAQHLVSMAAVQEYDVADAYELVKKCYCFTDISMERFESALRMLAGDYEHAHDKPITPRIHYDRINGHVIGNRLSSMLAVSSGGTIPDRGLYMVVLEDNTTRLGELDEEFVFEARLGDKFMLGAFSWQIMAIKRDRVVVRPSNTAGAQAPFWKGDGMNRPYETGLRYGRMLDNLNQAYAGGRLVKEFAKLTEDADAAINAARYLSEQIEAVGCLATHKVIIEERFKNETGEHLMMVHSVFGGLVNRSLAMLLKDAVEQVTSGDVRLWYDDDGVLIHLLGGGEIPENALGMLDERALKSQLAALMPMTPMFSMAFRYNAARALMMGVRPGGRVPLWVQRIRAAESYAQAADFPGHPLLIETMRECMEEQLDIDAAREVLLGVKSGAIHVVKKRVMRPSPMTIVLRQALELDMMYEYHPTPSAAAGLTVNDEEARLVIEPDRHFVESIAENIKPPADSEQLHDRLMIEGDMEAGEVNAPGEWLEWLAAHGRALYIEPGLWIAAEQRALYESALEGAPPENAEDMARVARRCLRFRGPMDLESLADRYMWGAEDARRALERLIADGAIIKSDGAYIHRDVYEQAQRMTLSARRREVMTAPPERYAALLANWQRHAGAPSDQLEAGITQLAGFNMPVDAWENFVLPARTQNYRPKILDDLLGQGRFVWRLTPGDRPAACFDLSDDVDWDADALEVSEQASGIASLLARRGASFAHAISSGLGGVPVAAALQDLAESGAARCDSFAPLRRYEGAQSVRQRLQMRNAIQDAGRWELTRPAKVRDMRESIARAFGRWAILCRETAALEGIDWRNALQTLRVMEYAGEIRRGYFVRGLSGAQFVQRGDFNRVTAALSDFAAREDDCACLCAADPAQAWGRILPLPEGVTFICVPGTAVITMHGAPALILERQGATLRVIIDDQTPFNAMAAAFRQGNIYPRLRSMTIKQYPIAAKERLEQCGFTREMRDYVMWK